MKPTLTLLLCLLPFCCMAQSGAIDSDARRGIDAGNQAWVDGMKRGDAGVIAATYAEDAVDCSPTGECIQGRAAIERQLRDRVQKLGRAATASVHSRGAVQQDSFVYEWGDAEAGFANGNRIAGSFLTVWRKEPGGAWRIFRNIRIPAGEPGRKGN